MNLVNPPPRFKKVSVESSSLLVVRERILLRYSVMFMGFLADSFFRLPYLAFRAQKRDKLLKPSELKCCAILSELV